MKYLQILFFIVISQAAGIIGSVFTTPAIPNWYVGLNKPFFNPPSWIFGPVWVLLYTLMGIAAYFIWLKRDDINLVKIALILFFVHLVFNTLWSIIFFGWQNPGLAFIEIIFLWLMIVALIIIYYQIDKRASYLMIPYLLWVNFATVLNYSIWRLN